MRVARKPFGLASILIDMSPADTERIGPFGMAVVCGSIGAAVALALL